MTIYGKYLEQCLALDKQYATRLLFHCNSPPCYWEQRVFLFHLLLYPLLLDPRCLVHSRSSLNILRMARMHVILCILWLLLYIRPYSDSWEADLGLPYPPAFTLCQPKDAPAGLDLVCPLLLLCRSAVDTEVGKSGQPFHRGHSSHWFKEQRTFSPCLLRPWGGSCFLLLMEPEILLQHYRFP